MQDSRNINFFNAPTPSGLKELRPVAIKITTTNPNSRVPNLGIKTFCHAFRLFSAYRKPLSTKDSFPCSKISALITLNWHIIRTKGASLNRFSDA